MPFRVLLAITIALCSTITSMAKDQEKLSPVGQKAQEFSLKDYRGKTHQLSDYADRELLVIVYLGTECPLAKLYAPRLSELHTKYAEQGVGCLGINANRQDSITEIAAYARIHDLKFPVLKDVGNVVADQLGAARTPEVFLLDHDRVVRYHGRIDDQ